MLTAYRRHRASCNKKGRRAKCFCPIWVQGVLRGETIRRSLDLTNWEAAQRTIRDLEIEGTKDSVSVKDACAKFLADCEGRKLSSAIIKKYTYVTDELIGAFGDRPVESVKTDDIRTIRNSWKYAGSTSQKRLEYIRAFFSFCISSGWIHANPAKAIKLPKVEASTTAPFEKDEWERIMWALDTYPEVHTDSPVRTQKQLRALILLLRHSGLRISDGVALKRERIDENGRLFVRTIKNKKAVWLPLPKDVIQAIDACDEGDSYLFWSGAGKFATALGMWRMRFGRIVNIAGVKGRGFAHRLRASFSVELLNKGVPLEMVATILGNSPRIVEKHYSMFVESRQVSLEAAVRSTW